MLQDAPARPIGRRPALQRCGVSTVLKKIAMVTSGFVAGVALTLVTVGAQTPTVAADEAQVAHMAAMKAQVMHTTYQLDSSGFHALDQSLQGGTLPPGSFGTVQRARVMAEATEWPDDLKQLATDEIAQLKLLETALKNEDVEAAKDPSHQVHEVGHDLSAKAYAWLGGAAAMSDEDHGGAPDMGH
jgi:hypothetical protein